jgi:hypothetical protein
VPFRALAAVAAALLPSGALYPVVGHVDSVPVRAPAPSESWGACPANAEPLDAAGLAGAKRAALLAMPEIARRSLPTLDLTGTRVIGLSHTRREGFILPTRRSCWGTPFLRSALVQVFLPAERASPAIRGNPWFYVARTPAGWIVWDEVH